MSTATASDTHNPATLLDTFLGPTPLWYKKAVIAALVLNVPAFFILGPLVTSWIILFEFIFTLAMALKCYPLQPGGLLAIEAVLMGLASPDAVYNEAVSNFQVILLLMFIVGMVVYVQYVSMPKPLEEWELSPQFLKWMVWLGVSLYLSILLGVSILLYLWKRSESLRGILATKLRQAKSEQSLSAYQLSRRYRSMKEEESGRLGTRASKE